MATACLDYRELMKDVLTEPGDFPDVYAFSIHKAGSTLLHSMIKGVCERCGIPALSIPDSLFKEGIFERDWEHDHAVLDVIQPGRVYYGFRNFPSVFTTPSLDIRNRKCVLLVRDPRDALISQYFSYGGRYISHALPKKNADAFIERARASQELSIDEYALRNARNYHNKLSAYRDGLNFEQVLLRRYEDVFFDKRGFLQAVFEHFGFDIATGVLDEVSRAHDVRPAVEDPSKHIRKGTPGDHAEKLQPETIERLNAFFRDIASWYGYDLR